MASNCRPNELYSKADKQKLGFYLDHSHFCWFCFQAVVLCSRKRFQITEQGDSLEFMSWLLNALDQTLKPAIAAQPGSKVAVKQTIVGKSLRGRMTVHSQKVMPVNISQAEHDKLSTDPEYMVSLLSTLVST